MLNTAHNTVDTLSDTVVEHCTQDIRHSENTLLVATILTAVKIKGLLHLDPSKMHGIHGIKIKIKGLGTVVTTVKF
jgi:hypothetical protein